MTTESQSSHKPPAPLAPIRHFVANCTSAGWTIFFFPSPGSPALSVRRSGRYRRRACPRGRLPGLMVLPPAAPASDRACRHATPAAAPAGPCRWPARAGSAAACTPPAATRVRRHKSLRAARSLLPRATAPPRPAAQSLPLMTSRPPASPARKSAGYSLLIPAPGSEHTMACCHYGEKRKRVQVWRKGGYGRPMAFELQ